MTGFQKVMILITCPLGQNEAAFQLYQSSHLNFFLLLEMVKLLYRTHISLPITFKKGRKEGKGKKKLETNPNNNRKPTNLLSILLDPLSNISFCYRIVNYPKLQLLKRINTYIISKYWKFSANSLACWFWFRVTHEVVVIRMLDWGQKICFKKTYSQGCWIEASFSSWLPKGCSQHNS